MTNDRTYYFTAFFKGYGICENCKLPIVRNSNTPVIFSKTDGWAIWHLTCGKELYAYIDNKSTLKQYLAAPDWFLPSKKDSSIILKSVSTQ